MFLTRQVITARAKTGVGIGDGGNDLVQRRMRGQANAAEQMPLTLLALMMAELLAGRSLILALLALVFIGGRLAHGIAFGWLDHSRPLRFWGMVASVIGSLGILIYLGITLLIATFS